MYRCTYCPTTAKPGANMLRHVMFRPDGNIASEVPVCPACKAELQAGLRLVPYGHKMVKAVMVNEPKPIPTPAECPSLFKPTFLGRPVNPPVKKASKPAPVESSNR